MVSIESLSSENAAQAATIADYEAKHAAQAIAIKNYESAAAKQVVLLADYARQLDALRADLACVHTQLVDAEARAVEALAVEEPLVIRTDRGLCNRLRSVLSYQHIAQSQERKLIVVWESDAECNGHFLESFAPLAGVHFVRQPPSWEPEPDCVCDTHPDVGAAAEIDGYSRLVLTHAVQEAVDAHVVALAPFVAVHVRRTDLPVFMGPGFARHGQTTDAAFHAFLREHSEHNVHIATCCAQTHAAFSEAYTERLAGVGPPAFTSDQLRQTSLTDAVIDLYTCASSEFYLGSNGSSFSETIGYLRAHNRQQRMDRATAGARVVTAPGDK